MSQFRLRQSEFWLRSQPDLSMVKQKTSIAIANQEAIKGMGSAFQRDRAYLLLLCQRAQKPLFGVRSC